MTYHIDDTPLVQFPIRLSKDLHTRFTRVSQETRINKSTLLRIALDRLVTQIQIYIELCALIEELSSIIE